MVSCYPTANTTLTQNSYVNFVCTCPLPPSFSAQHFSRILISSYAGNSQQPAFTQTNSVNIYLYHADSQEEMFVFRNLVNPTGEAGVISIPINDSWWPKDWSGSEETYPYYFKIKRSDQELNGFDTSLPVFSAVREYTSLPAVLQILTVFSLR